MTTKTFVLTQCPCEGTCTDCPCHEGQNIVDERDVLETMIDALCVEPVLFFEEEVVQAAA